MKIRLYNLKPIEGNHWTPWRSQPKGEQLFSALCYQLQLMGVNLDILLAEYTENKPFLVVSDPLINKSSKFYITKPYILHHQNNDHDNNQKYIQHTQESLKERKAQKNKTWYPVKQLPLLNNSKNTRHQEHVKYFEAFSISQEQRQMHNTINRLTNSTDDQFAKPFEKSQWFYESDVSLVVLCAFDDKKFNDAKITTDTLDMAWKNLGLTGYGADASTGKGLFSVENLEIQSEFNQLAEDDKSYIKECQWFSLSSSFIKANEIKKEESSYRFHTHFGRHTLLNQGVQVFKKPVCVLQKSALLRFEERNQQNSLRILGKISISNNQIKQINHFNQIIEDNDLTKQIIGLIGHGLGGENTPISSSYPNTVHQGYSLVFAI